MRPPAGRTERRAPTAATGLGLATLGGLFGGFFLGGAVSAPEALGLTAAIAALAVLGWSVVASPVSLRPLAIPGLGLLATIMIGAVSAVPWGGAVVRTGLYAGVGGESLSIDAASSLIEIAKLAGLGCAFICGLLAAGRRGASSLVDACMVLTSLWAIWAIVLFVANGSQGRLGAPFLSPNTAATLLGVGAVLTLGRLLDDRGSAPGSRSAWRIVCRGSALVLLIAALCLTQSRAGLALAVLACLGLLMARPVHRVLATTQGKAMMFGVATVFLLVVADVGREAGARLPHLGEATSDRWEIFKVYWRAVVDAPLFGGGLGSAGYVTKLGLTPDNYDAIWNVRSAHNWALQWLAEAGILGAAAMGGAILALFMWLFRGLSERSAAVLAPLLFADGLILVHGLTDFALQIPAFALYWSFLLGVQMAACRPDVRRGESASEARQKDSGP